MGVVQVTDAGNAGLASRHEAAILTKPVRAIPVSRQHLTSLVHAYLRLPGVLPGGRSPDDAFTVLSPIDGHCVAIDWCAVDDTALICAHPFEGRDSLGTCTGAGDEEHEAVHDLGRDGLGQWWLHEDLITGRTTLALRAPVATWTLDDFSTAFETFCRRLASMRAEPDSVSDALATEQSALVEVAEPLVDLLFWPRA